MSHFWSALPSHPAKEIFRRSSQARAIRGNGFWLKHEQAELVSLLIFVETCSMAVIRACNAFFSVEIQTKSYSSFSRFPSGAFKNLIYMPSVCKSILSSGFMTGFTGRKDYLLNSI